MAAEARLLGGGCFGAVALAAVDSVRLPAGCIQHSAPGACVLLGRFPELAALRHPHLVRYIEAIKCTNLSNVVILIAEHHEKNLDEQLRESRQSPPVFTLDVEWKLRVAAQVSAALAYLHSKAINVVHVDLESVLVVEKSPPLVRLSQYGVSHVTGDGKEADFRVGNAFAVSPEQLVSKDLLPSTAGDVWAFGVLFLQVLVERSFADLWNYKQFFAILQLPKGDGSREDSMLPVLTNALKAAKVDVAVVGEAANSLSLQECLFLMPSRRPTSFEVAESLKSFLPPEPTFVPFNERPMPPVDWKVRELPIDDAFYLWKLAGATPEKILVGSGVIRLQNPITILPSLVIGDFLQFGNEQNRHQMDTYRTINLPMKNLTDVCAFRVPNGLQRIMAIPNEVFLHSVLLKDPFAVAEGTNLPVIVKEKDIAYQVWFLQSFILF